jgi:Ca2+-binding EF-hand superfamily protein
LNTEDIFFKFDTEATGNLNKQQFFDLILAFNKKTPENELEQLFDLFNDGNQKVSLDEFNKHFF